MGDAARLPGRRRAEAPTMHMRGGDMGLAETGATKTEALDPFGYATHEVLNQPPPLADYDAFGTDPVLPTIVRTFGAEWAQERLHEAGKVVGSAHVQELARQANRNLPELRTHDRFGNQIGRASCREGV